MYQEIINGYSPVGDIFLIAICFVCNIVARETFLKSSKTTLLFKVGVIDIVTACLANVLTYYIAKNGGNSIYVVLFRDIYHCCLLFLFLIYEFYLAFAIGYERKQLIQVMHAPYVCT